MRSSTMEYLGRLGLVPRRNKERATVSPCQVVDSKQTPRRCVAEEPGGADRSSISAALGTAHTQGLVEIRGASSTELPRPAANLDMADHSFFPRRSTSGQDAFIDIEYLEYERHVKARAQALGNVDNFGAPGGRHAWKTLIFWKRRRHLPPGGRSFVSAASTPLHHPAFQAPGGKSRRHGSRSSRNPAMQVPLYVSDEFTTSAIRPWWEPMGRGPAGNLSMPARQDAENCKMSPYVPLGGGRQRLATPGPLYLV